MGLPSSGAITMTQINQEYQANNLGALRGTLKWTSSGVSGYPVSTNKWVSSTIPSTDFSMSSLYASRGTTQNLVTYGEDGINRNTARLHM